MSIDPKNVSAHQLAYQARGNPPGAHPQSAVGNFFPGLEFNFLSAWKRIFIGIELNESSGDVMGVDHSAPPDVRALLGWVLVGVDVVNGPDGIQARVPVAVPVTGPSAANPQGGNTMLIASLALEWGNALAGLHFEKGGTNTHVPCLFENPETGERRIVSLKVRRLFEPGTAMIAADAVEPGELTQSLCSPWQTDFIGCACYYWAANRPDYINLWDKPDGSAGGGHNWLDAKRSTQPDPKGEQKAFYSLDPTRTLKHEDILRSQDWETKLRFVIGGKDEAL